MVVETRRLRAKGNDEEEGENFTISRRTQNDVPRKAGWNKTALRN